jgi:hypothetical protein
MPSGGLILRSGPKDCVSKGGFPPVAILRDARKGALLRIRARAFLSLALLRRG